MRKQCINELEQEQVQKNSSWCCIYTWRGEVTGVTADAAWTSPVTRPPLAPLGEHSRPGWFLERRRTCSHLQTVEDAGIAGNDLELPAGAVQLDGTPEGVPSTEVGGLVRQWGTLLTNLAALCWIISSWSTYLCWYGSQIQEQYSSLGRTTALCDFSFNCCGHLFRDRQRNPSKRFAAPLMLICSFHRGLLFIVTPRYTQVSVGQTGYPIHGILMTDFVACCIGDGNNVRFLHIKFQIKCPTSCSTELAVKIPL